MLFRPIYEEGLAQASYMVSDGGKALIVDPRRDIDIYLDIAAREEFTITEVAETHIHADYLSGARELAAATGATLYLSGEGPEDSYERGGSLPTKFLKHGDRWNVGNVRIRARHCPGHTPEHICFEVFDDPQKPQPMLLLSGDFIFVGDVGRPDLLEQALQQKGTARIGAQQMFSSLRAALAELPDYVQIWPAHGAGSACGKALSAIPSTTLGYERRFSWWSYFLEHDEEQAFEDALLQGQPDAASYFATMKRLNRGSMPLLHHLPEPKRLDKAAVKPELEHGAVLVDTRPQEAFAKGHPAGAISIIDQPSFSTRSAWFVPFGSRIILLAKPERVSELVRRLVRVGLDNVIGYVPDVESTGLPVEVLGRISTNEAARQWSQERAVILDVRSKGEYESGHIPGALHISTAHLLQKLDAVPKSRPLVVHCAGGSRGASAASVLVAHGFPEVAELKGGFNDWEASRQPVESGSPQESSVA